MTCTGVKDFFPGRFMFQAPHHQEEGQDEPPPPPPPPPQQLHHRPPTSHSSMIPSCPPPDFNGVGKRWAPFSRAAEVCPEEGNGGDAEEVSDEGSPGGEKKRRLNLEQVRTLEQSFEMGNKLEPERKAQLARALGLQPRQVAIWFQNRRARWKTKKLEKDYDLLKRQLEAIEADNNALQAQNQKLRAEIVSLKSREATESINLNKETEGSCSNRSDNSTDNLKLEISRTATTMDSPISSRNTPPGSSISFFPSSMNRPTATAANTFSQLFQNHSSARTESHLQCPKMSMDQTGVHKDESLCNMFGSMDDHPGFWPWLEQHNFN